MENNQEATAGPVQQEDEISLLDLLIVLAKYKRMILGLPFAAALVATGISLMLPNYYTATTKILPPQQASSAASAMLSQLGGLAGAAAGVAGLKNPNDLYIGMIKSRTVADNMIGRFELAKVYETDYPTQTRKELADATVAASGKDGIISIDVTDEDPKRAAALANGYVEELVKLTRVLAVTEASRRRLFFENQLNQAKENLTKAELAARHGLEQGGLVKVDDQGRAMVETSARLRAQVAAKEVQVGAMRSFAASENPDLRLAEQELAQLKHQLAKIEGAGGPREKITQRDATGMDSLSLLRDIKYYETIYELLAKQYEVAKIDEAKDSAVIQILDIAIEPDRKSKPKRLLIVLLTVLAVGFLTVLFAFVREVLVKSRSSSESAGRLAELRAQLKWR